MKDIKVDWSLSPKGATELVKVDLIGQKWRNSKTKQYWDMNGDFGGYYSESSQIDEAKVFAIRPQIAVVADAVEQPNFKATREKESEKWTHETILGGRCMLRHQHDKMVWVLMESGCEKILNAASIKPIKPTISQEQAKAVLEFATEHGLISEGQIWTSMEREIIEVPAND